MCIIYNADGSAIGKSDTPSLSPRLRRDPLLSPGCGGPQAMKENYDRRNPTVVNRAIDPGTDDAGLMS